MATKLKNMKLTSVDLVRAGANQEADICLYKSAEPPEATETTIEKEKGLLKRFLDWLRENPAEEESEPQNEPPVEKEAPHDAEDFDELTEKQAANETLDFYLDAIEDSIKSIQLDDSLEVEQKQKIMQDSLQEFNAAMEALVPELCATKPEKEPEAFDMVGYMSQGMEIGPDGRVRPARKSARFDTLEEVEKYNHNHGADGKFASGPGGGGGGSADVTGSATRNRARASQIYEKNPGTPMSGSISSKKVKAAVERGGRMHTNEESGKSYLISPQEKGGINVYVGTKTKSGGLDVTESIRGIKTAEDAHDWARGATAGKSSKSKARADRIVNSRGAMGANRMSGAKSIANRMAEGKRTSVDIYDLGEGPGRYMPVSGKDSHALHNAGYERVATVTPNATHKSARFDTIEEAN